MIKPGANINNHNEQNVQSGQRITLHGNKSFVWVNTNVTQRIGIGHDLSSISCFIELLLSAELNPIETLKDDPDRSIVQRVQVTGQHFVIKRYRVPAWKSWLLHQLRQSPTWREWRGTEKLMHVGRRVNMPLATLYQPSRGHEAQVLILPYVEGASLDKIVEEAPPVQEWSDTYRNKRIALAQAVGTQLGRLLASGIVNRDHKLSNLIMDKACEHGGQEPIMIDPLGLRMRRSDNQVYRMLAMLVRTTERAGYITPRECITCLKAFLQMDLSFALGVQRRQTVAIKNVLRLLGRS